MTQTAPLQAAQKSCTKSCNFCSVIFGICLFFSMVALLVFPRITSEAVVSALRLCGSSLLPSLFPFFVCSELMLRLGFTHLPARLLGRLMRPLFGVSPASSTALFLGAVGGYPSGAKAIADLWQSRTVSAEEAQQLLRFCSNAGPAFVLGVVGTGVFGSLPVGATLYAIHIFSALLTGFLLKRQLPTQFIPKAQHPRESPGFAPAFTAAVRKAGETALTVCMFVVVFAVFSQFLHALLPTVTPSLLRTLLSGLLELSNGMALLGEARLPPSISLPLASFLLAFGGLGVLAQTAALFSDTPLSLSTYLPAKLLQATFSALFTALLFPLLSRFFDAVPVFAPLFAPVQEAKLVLWPVIVIICLYFRNLMTGNPSQKRV